MQVCRAVELQQLDLILEDTASLPHEAYKSRCHSFTASWLYHKDFVLKYLTFNNCATQTIDTFVSSWATAAFYPPLSGIFLVTVKDPQLLP